MNCIILTVFLYAVEVILILDILLEFLNFKLSGIHGQVENAPLMLEIIFYIYAFLQSAEDLFLVMEHCGRILEQFSVVSLGLCDIAPFRDYLFQADQ